MKQYKHKQAFSLVELLVVIAIIGLLSTVVGISFSGARQKAFLARNALIQGEANFYCATNPGVSYPNGDQAQPVYCDSKLVMWSITLSADIPGVDANKFAWAVNGKEVVSLPSYAKGDCNNLTDADIVDYPACQVCRNLDYAGFSEGWRLPIQERRGPNYNCVPDSQLWDFGAENCSNWGSSDCNSSQGKCLPSYDSQAKGEVYWSSIQEPMWVTDHARYIDFSNAYTSSIFKSFLGYVRCCFGHYHE